ncbi:hypothetical protein F4604DRAFT_1915507 [Suillus subluteus]|nr:hypothetical protein F4604DRAFT_1915507 [Suillus subluteus]
MSTTESLTADTMHPQPLIDVLVTCENAPNAASTKCLATLACTNNPRFWDSKIRNEQWFNNNGQSFTMLFPAMLEPEIKDVHTVKAQFELQTLDDSFPEEAVVCSKKAANTLMYVVSTCKKIRKSDKHEVIQFIKPLFPEAAEPTWEIVPEFSLEDFKNMDVTFTRVILRQEAGFDVNMHSWTIKDMPDPHGHFQTVMDLYSLDNIPVVVPNVRDADGSLIHPSEYSNQLDNTTPVAVEVLLQL